MIAVGGENHFAVEGNGGDAGNDSDPVEIVDDIPIQRAASAIIWVISSNFSKIQIRI